MAVLSVLCCDSPLTRLYVATTKQCYVSILWFKLSLFIQAALSLVLSKQLLIKAVEVRVLGKTVVIGNKVCETKDLFSPHPQLMTVNLNPSGSLKLNIVITWK